MNSETEPIRIVLVDDHELIREGTLRILEKQPRFKVVGEGGDGRQAIALIEGLHPDLVILDIRMPGENGIEVVRYSKERFPEIKALILTAYDDDDYILALMEAGADGYLLKTASSTEIVDAVERILAGETILHPEISAKIARLWASQRKWASRDRYSSLSPREQEVLRLAALGYRNKSIGDTLSISVRTVEGHFTNILSKLGVSSRVEAVLFTISQKHPETSPLDRQQR